MIKYTDVDTACMDFIIEPFVVANVEVIFREGTHQWTVAGVPYQWNYPEVAHRHYPRVLGPADFMGKSQLSRMPLKFAQGLCEGELEPEVSHIVSRGKNVIYVIEGYPDRVVLSDASLEWFRNWKGNGGFKGMVDTLRRTGSLDDTTYEILEKRIREPVRSNVNPAVNPAVNSAVSHAVKTSDKDLRKLDMIHKENISEHLSYAEWGKFLGLSRQGAGDWLHRMQEEGNLQLEVTSKGTKATLTDLAKNALKVVRPSQKKPRP